MNSISQKTIVTSPTDAAAAELSPLGLSVRTSGLRLGDFFELTKPRMNFLVIVTTLVGYYLANGDPGQTSWVLCVNTLIGTALAAASAATLNQWMERRLDGLMPRTRNRPLPAGRVMPVEALAFGVALGVAGVAYLGLLVNPLTAALGLITILGYLLIYTPLKRRSTINTIIGAVPGAIPPMMGFTAVENSISPAAWLLFGVLFLWQMPHFLAIATLYRDDYARGGYRMLPVVDPTLRHTCRMILLYTLALIPVTLIAVPLNISGVWYGVAALVLGAGFLWYGVRVWQTRQRADARKLFFASIIYLPLLLAAMMIDKT